MDFVHKAELNPNSGSVRSHLRIGDAMAVFQQIDQLNLPAVLGIEILMRYLVQIEAAVSRIPKCPDYADLDGITGAFLSEHATLVLPNYQKWVANIQRDEAFTMKQRRLWQEEQKPSFRRNHLYTTPAAEKIRWLTFSKNAYLSFRVGEV